jgi:uncharacterized protein (TIGR03083 family)
MTRSAVLAPRVPALDHRTAMQLAATEYDRFLALLRALDADDWAKPTDCAEWDVRMMAAHLLGMVEMAASLREQRRQNRAAQDRLRHRGGLFIDALTGIQVDERRDMTPDEIMARFAARAPKAAAGRRRAPGFVRRRQLPVAQDVGGSEEVWTIGYLTEVILTRDPWMHRIDIARATGADLVHTADHDGVLVADVVAEWAERHGAPFTLRLTGPAGGTWSRGTGGPALELDAAEFCRTVSGREAGEGLLGTQVPF